MARRGLNNFGVLWKKHEVRYLQIFTETLSRLAEGNDINGDENAISEKLSLLLLTVCFEKSKSENVEIKAPQWEKPINPVTEDELKGGKKQKIPDFTCILYNPFSDSEEDYELPLHVECKCLGNPTSPSWKLNEKYVTDGINRFDNITHQYGKRTISGMMVGYMVSMTPIEILNEVNSFQKKHLPENPEIAFSFNNTITHHTEQCLTRKKTIPEKFTLHHLWVNFIKKSDSDN